jgi:hypothetical protein
LPLFVEPAQVEQDGVGSRIGLAKVFLEVHSGCERFACAGKHEHAAPIIDGERLHRALHLGNQRRIHGVSLLRSIQHHPGDAVFELDQDILSPRFWLRHV